MIHKTDFKHLVIIQNKKYKDSRGFFMEILKNKDLKKNFPFVVCSYSKKNVIRGLHIQTKNPQGKYISVLKGKIVDIVIDLRKSSKTFGKTFKIILSDKNCKSLFIPPGFAHGFCGLDRDNYIIYNCTKYRHAKSEIGINYKDKDLKIKWPIKKPIISKKDKNNLSFIDFKKKYIKNKI